MGWGEPASRAVITIQAEAQGQSRARYLASDI